MTKIKICGLKRAEEIAVANELALSYIGFVFAKSKRQVTIEEARVLKAHLNTNCKAVGVFVNHNVLEMIQLVDEGIIDVIQLHGNETEDVIMSIRQALPNVELIKAVSVISIEDVIKWNHSQVDYLLLDNGSGGSGMCFDWNILHQVDACRKPYFIAGGLTPDNVSQVIPFAPYGVDVSGGVETKGVKDVWKMRKFVEKVRGLHE
ncbi:MAG: phosphoribosylanthranilate isomerase [Eubacteriales bacterium]